MIHRNRAVTDQNGANGQSEAIRNIERPGPVIHYLAAPSASAAAPCISIFGATHGPRIVIVLDPPGCHLASGLKNRERSS